MSWAWGYRAGDTLVVKPTFSLSVGKYMDKSADDKHFVIVLPLFRPNLSVSAHFPLPCVIVSGPQACLPDGVALRFPAAGNTIPKGWEHDSQGLGTRFPRAGCLFLISLDTFLLHYLKQ